MASNQKIIKNYIYNVAYQVLLVIAPLITSPYIARVLGVTGVGVYNYAYSIVTYFALFGTLGSSLYGQREIAYMQDDAESRSKIFWEIVCFRSITIIISLVVYYFAIVRTSDYYVVALIVMAELITAAFDVSWFFQGMEDFKTTVVRNTIVKILGIILIFVFVKSPEDIELYTICCTLPTLIGNLSLWPYLKKYIVFVKVSFQSIRSYLKPMLALFIPQIATQVYAVLDKTMLGELASSVDEVGYYTYSQHIVKTMLQIITSLGIVMLPAMSSAFAKGNMTELINKAKTSLSFMFILGSPLMIGLAGISYTFVDWFYGENFETTAKLMIITSPIILLIGISTVTGRQFLLPAKRQKEFTYSVVMGAVVNFCLNLILIKYMDSIGAAIATVIAEFAVTAVQLYFLREYISVIELIKKNYRYIVFSLIMLLPMYGVSLVTNGVVETFVQIIVAVVTYAALLVISRDEFFLQSVKTFSSMVKRKAKNNSKS